MYRKVVLWQMRATEKAYLFSTLPKDDPHNRVIWIPRSQIKHISREPKIKPDDLEKCIVDVAEWLADKHDL